MCTHSSNSIFEKVHLLDLELNRDQRGLLFECFSQERVSRLFGWEDFQVKQQNVVFSKNKVVRGMHRTVSTFPQNKIVICIEGQITDVILDTCSASPTYGEAQKFILDGRFPQLLTVPSCAAHGFQTISESSLIVYFLDQVYKPENQIFISAYDKTVIDFWTHPIEINERDKSAKKLSNDDFF